MLVVYSYYLPIWFQSIQGKSPQSSGLSLLHLLLSIVDFVMASGMATSVLGYYTPFLIIGAAVSIVSSALISTCQVDAAPGIWIGYQVWKVFSPLPKNHIMTTKIGPFGLWIRMRSSGAKYRSADGAPERSSSYRHLATDICSIPWRHHIRDRMPESARE